MIRLECDNAKVEHHLRKLLALVEKNGGFLSKSLVIRCQEGNLSLHGKDNSAAGKWLVRLPPACLLPLKQFELTVCGDAFCIASKAAELSAGRLQLLEVFLALLNENGKAKSLRENDPVMLKVDDPELFTRFAEGRVQGSGSVPESHGMDDRQAERLLLITLNKTRALTLPSVGNTVSPGLAFMPVVDFVNHHCLAPGFDHQVEPGGHRRLSLTGFFPFASTMECFVKYSDYDAYDLYFNYGFVEKNTTFVRSVPMEISLPGLGGIKVRASVATVQHTYVPPEMAHLAPYLPAITFDRATRVLEVSFLLIPRQTANPLALRRVLQILLTQFDPTLSQLKCVEYMEMVEEQLLAGNVQFYQSLLDYLEKLEPARRDKSLAKIQAAREMIRVQLSQLANYRIFRHTLKVQGFLKK